MGLLRGALNVMGGGTKPAPAVKKEPNGNGAPAAAPAELDPVNVDTVLDTLATIVRAYGRFGFDLESRSAKQLEETTQRWMRHITMGAAHPNNTDADQATSGVKRDWPGLSRYMTDQRRQEAGYVVKTVDDLRQVIWSFVHGVTQVVSQDEEADRRTQHQLKRLEDVVENSSTEELKREALSAVAAISGVLEERKLKTRTQMAELGQQLRALGRQLEEARRESQLDSLTGLANRKAFDDFLTRTVELHTLTGEPACLLMLDVDHFKKLNDTFGHPAGDAVLRRLSGSMARTFLRRCDFVARYGGEEFAVILHETKLKDGVRLAERLQTSVRALPFQEDAKGIETVTISIGVAEMVPGEKPTAWVERADKALYAAKQGGRDRVMEAPPPAL